MILKLSFIVTTMCPEILILNKYYVFYNMLATRNFNDKYVYLITQWDGILASHTGADMQQSFVHWVSVP